MTLYPWRQYGKNTTEEIASQVESQWETPGGAQQKADQAEENAKKYADENFAKNAFSKVASPGRATVESEDKEDTLTLEAGTGIAITTDPAQKKVTIWTQGDSAPGAHGETHNHDGTDPIPDLVQLRDDFDDYKNEIRSLGLGIDVDPRLSSDLNQEINTGWVTTASNTLNRPPASHGVVRIERRAATRVVQTFYSLGGSADVKIYTRASGGSLGDVWSDWVEVLHTGNTGSIVTEDYETGTWTPEYITTGDPFTNISFIPGTSGSYTKIGRMVFIRFNIATDYLEKGNASGQLRIAGLPFPHGETSSVRHIGLSIANAAGFEISPIENYYRWRMSVIPNSTEIAIYQNNPNSTFASAGPEILRDHTSSQYNVLRASGVYYTSSN